MTSSQAILIQSNKTDRENFWPIVDDKDNRIIYGYIDIIECDPEDIATIPMPDHKHWLEPVFYDEANRLLTVDLWEYPKDQHPSETDRVEVCVGCGSLVGECAVHATRLCPNCRLYGDGVPLGMDDHEDIISMRRIGS